MANLTGSERARYVQAMFGRIARRYDLMNRLMTFGQDSTWRREVIRHAAVKPGEKLLDLGTGTGDIAHEGLLQVPSSSSIAADFTMPMMHIGQTRFHDQRGLYWVAADAQNLPFPEACFDAVVSGFLLRNVPDVDQALKEQYRVLKPGGRIAGLDTTPPPPTLLAPLIRFHLHTIIPNLGRLITGQADAYTYLPDSTEGFLAADTLAQRMKKVGFTGVEFQRRMFGTIAIHWGRKSAR